MKKDAYWFSHDSNAKDDPKSMKLIDQLGLEGYGIYWVLIEILRDQPDYRYPLDMIPILARRYNTSGEKMKAVVSAYELFTIDEKDNFFSTSLDSRMQVLEGHREQRRLAGLKSADARATKQLPRSTDVQRPLQRRCNAGQLSKVKKSKVKKSKEEENKEDNNTPSFIDNSNQLLVKKWCEWCDFRKLLKKPYKTTPGTAASYNKLLRIADNNSEMAIAIITQSMENEWLGFFPLKNNNKANAPPGEDITDYNLKEIKRIRKERLDREALEKQQKYHVKEMMENLEFEKMLEDGIEK